MVKSGGMKGEGARSAGRERRVVERTVKSGGKMGGGWHSEGREIVRQ
jgi:hypothetical protein